MQRFRLFPVLIVLSAMLRPLDAQEKTYVCAYVWPSCHDDSLAHHWLWEEGIGEWEVIRQGDPRWPGHYQPREPLWGYEMDNDPAVVEKWIQTALKYGVNTFIYDWYWYSTEDGYSGPYLESALNDGFLKAPSHEKMNFYVMWANHDVKYNYWNWHKWGKREDRLFNPDMDWERFRKVVRRLISQYFSQPGYVKIDGCPVLGIFSIGNFIRGFGSLEEAARAMEYFREEVRKAGFPDLHLQEIQGGGYMLPEGTVAYMKQYIGKLGINSEALYNMGGFDPDYLRHGQKALDIRRCWDESFDIPVFPCVSVGWDDTPRFPAKGPGDATRFHQTPQAFAGFLQQALDYVNHHPEQPRFLMINAWNEWVEGSYLLPDRRYGFGYLQAVRDVLDGKYVTLNNTKVDGFRPIWFDLKQKSEYGSKYSGAFGTYTMKHRPLAIYSPEADKTYFVYGGTTAADERHLLCMISCFDHKTGLVQKPTVVYDKREVNDPHDNPALLIDDQGYIWVYVAGRGNRREGIRFRSGKPYDISSFEEMGRSIMAYPQPYFVKGKGHFLFETRYDGVRRLFFQTSPDGIHWTDYQPIASMIDTTLGERKSGHYQITARRGDTLVCAFNRHLNGDCDTRTNIYFIQTTDFGQHWTQVDGTPVTLPVTDRNSSCKVLDLEQEKMNCYIKDVNFDEKGHPVILYLTSHGHQPGPKHGPRAWYTAHWTGNRWDFRYITQSTHNYDSGSLWVEGKNWTVIAPTGEGPQKWGQGGEIEAWASHNHGRTWKRALQYTANSPFNHCYVRRPENGKDPFWCFWADGHADALSISHLYFGDSRGQVYRLPYEMMPDQDWVAPKVMQYPFDAR